MITYLVFALSAALAILGMVRYKKQTMPFKLLSLYLLYSFIIDIVNPYISYKFKHNASVVHIQITLNYVFFSLIYYHLFKNKYIKRFIWISIILVSAFSVINALFLQPFNTVFPSNVILITEILLVIFSLLMFKQMLLYPVQFKITKQSIFWFNTAILFVSTTMFLNLELMNFYSHHRSISAIVYYFWYIDDIIFNLLLGVAILTAKKEVVATNE